MPTCTRLARGMPRFAVFAGAFVVAVGAVMLGMWVVGRGERTALAPGWPLMTANTALFCVLIGSALILAAPASRPAWARVAGTALASVTIVLTALILLEYATGASLGIDQVLVRTTKPTLTRFPGRPSPTSAAGFALAAAALILLVRAPVRLATWAHAVAIASGTIATFSLLGYVFGIPEFYSLPALRPQTGLSMASAVTLLAASAAILAARPDVGLAAIVSSEHAGGVMARRLLPSLLTFLPMALVVIVGERRGWYDRAVVSALLVFCGLVLSTIFILLTAQRLTADDLARLGAEARVQERERRYRELVEHAPDGVLVADLDGRYTEANEAGCRLLRLTREQIVGRTIMDVIRPEDVPRLLADRAQLMRGGVVVSEWEIRRGDGTLLPVEVSATILADGRWQAFIRDVSLRKRQEAQLASLYAGEARQRAWLRTTIDQLPEGVALLDGEGRRVATNRAMLAFSSGEVMGTDPFGNPVLFDTRTPSGTLVSFDDLPIVRALRDGQVTMGRELVMRLGDGRMVPVLANAAPVRDDQDQIVGASAVLQDVSTRKELERLREEWASVVAHDLRQPVTSIALSAQALIRMHGETLGEVERRSLERIQTAAARLDRMINDLLDASLIEAHRLSVSCRAVDLAALVDGVAGALRDAIPDHHLEVRVEPEQTVWIDPDRIHQVLANLITNAAKYGSPGGDIRLEAIPHDHVIEVAVTNVGPGIQSDELPEMFTRFRRGRAARAEGTRGTGLGLYIAKGLVEAHGGQMWADSTPGQTTTFHFTVPRAPTAPEHRGEQAGPL